MSIPGLLLAMLMALLALAVVAYPLLRGQSASDADSRQDDIDARYERALLNIRDLDEDHATGKLDAQSYRTEREVWVQRGIELLRMMDERGRQA